MGGSVADSDAFGRVGEDECGHVNAVVASFRDGVQRAQKGDSSSRCACVDVFWFSAMLCRGGLGPVRLAGWLADWFRLLGCRAAGLVAGSLLAGLFGLQQANRGAAHSARCRPGPCGLPPKKYPPPPAAPTF